MQGETERVPPSVFPQIPGKLVTWSLHETVRLAIDDGDSAFVVAGGACVFVRMREACDGLADARSAQGDQ